MKVSSVSRATATALALAFLLMPAPGLLAQSRRTPPQQPQKKNTRPDEQQPTDQTQPSQQQSVPPDAIKDTEVVKVSSNIVQIEAVVYSKKTGKIVTGLKKENFAVFEDGVQKEVSNFSTPDAPITVSLVLEYSQLGQLQAYYGSSGMDRYGMEEMLGPTVAFLQQFIKPPDDYVSVIAYDMRPTPLTDFTNDPARITRVINLLLTNRPVSREANLYDALKLTLVGGRADSVVLEDSKESMAEYAGMTAIKDGRRKAIFLITTGIDTFSKINYDQARKIAQNSGVPIYIIGTGELFFKKYGDQMDAMDGLGGATDPGRMTMLQARNALRTFADESGGAYFPITFPGELPSALQSINALMRNQYSLAYKTGERHDGKRHKIEVKVDVDGDGKYDDKEYVVKARQFYNAPKS
ncbi:MAG TPA: VWA domain-containing protein [Pyrinomonadaceae bacterium]|jgi:VWFA-related protein|nr:VWA domain-containing protein [Pyrinomonadaceae bacterium]